MEELAFAAGERELLSAVQGIQEDDWPLRFWCAKEAVAKAWGQGLVDGPRSLVVKALDTDSGAVQVGLSEQLARRVGQVHGDTRRHRDDLVVTALTAREGDLVTAVSVREGD
jgi:phosphopantetheinyl transferase